MDRSTPITLISKTYTTDAIGQMIATESTNVVFADIQSVSRSEFFAGGERGFNPQFVASLFAPDYNGEDLCELIVHGKTEQFSIYRTYDNKRNDSIEIYLEKRTGK